MAKSSTWSESVIESNGTCSAANSSGDFIFLGELAAIASGLFGSRISGGGSSSLFPFFFFFLAALMSLFSRACDGGRRGELREGNIGGSGSGRV